MTRSISLRLGGALLALGLSESAFASALSDFKAGQDVYLNVSVVQFDGKNYATAAHLLPKDAGSLNITLSGAALGLNTSASITLTGTENPSTQTITWSFNKTFSPPLHVDDNHYVDQVYGQIVAQHWLLPGEYPSTCGAKSCERNTSFQLAPGSSITVNGHSEVLGVFDYSWTEPVKVLNIKGLGGVPRPTLSGLFVKAPEPLCSREYADTKLSVGAWVSSVAPTGGAKIDFASSSPSHIALASSYNVPAGFKEVYFDAIIKPGVSGLFSISAWANGAKLTRVFTVLPASHPDCNDSKDPFDVKDYGQPILQACTSCTVTPVDLSIYDDGILRKDRVDYYLDGLGGAVNLPVAMGVSVVDTRDIADTGAITGQLMQTNTSPWQAFKINPRQQGFAPQVLGDFTPRAINNKGSVVGFRTSSSGNIAVVHDGSQLRDVPLSLSTRNSEALGVSDTGYVIGKLTDSDGATYGFRHYAGRTEKLPSFRNTSTAPAYPSLPAAVNDFGVVAANFQDSQGYGHAVLLSTDGAVRHLSTPAGFTRLQANSLNNREWVAATAYSATGSRGFIYSPLDGLRDLNTLIPSSLGIVITDALRVTDANTVLVRGSSSQGVRVYRLHF